MHDAVAYSVPETDTTSYKSRNVQVDIIEVDTTEVGILLSHRGQKVAHNGIICSDATQEKQHSCDTFMLDILGNALVIVDALWSIIFTKDLQHMLDSMNGVVNTRFSLRCLNACRQKVNLSLA